MKAVFHQAQRAHDPKHFLSSGAPRPNPEQPARIDALLGALQAMGLDVQTPADHGLGPIAAVAAALNLPTVIVQEGGYLCPELGDNLRSFLSGFLDQRL